MRRRSVAGMFKLVRSLVSEVARRFRSRAALELENLALRDTPCAVPDPV